MKIENLTPHKITFVKENGDVILEVEPSGTVARVTTQTVQTGKIAGIPITETVFGEVENLPEPSNGTVYVVSLRVAQTVPYRSDVFIPNESVRNDDGVIIGCKSLGRI